MKKYDITKERDLTVLRFAYFFAPKIKDVPLFIRKMEPATRAKQFHYFDLMGRPAKQKQHIFKVVK